MHKPIKIFCLNKIKKNVFLVDIDLSGSNFELLEELIDLRLIHQIKSRVTVGDRPGKVFKAFLLDVSQYTGERARRDVEMIEFWKDSNKGKLRLASLIYDPNISLEELEKEVELKKGKGIENKPQKDNTDDKQGKLF